MIDQLAQKIAIFLNQRNEGIVSEAVMKFALIIILNIIAVFILILSLGIFTNTFKESLLALFGFAFLRYFSGGMHVKTSTNCILATCLLFLFIIYVPLSSGYQIIFQILSTILVFIFAPSYIKWHVRIKSKNVRFLKIISVIIVLSNFFLDSSILTKCFFIQSLTLIEIRRKGE